MAAWQSLIGLDAKWLVELFSALLTPTIAIIATYVAYQQWRINKTRLDLDLYDRRLDIYKAVDEFYNETVSSGGVTISMVKKLRAATPEARFLFPKEIEVFLKTLCEKGMRAEMLRQHLDSTSRTTGLPVGDTRNKAVDEESKLLDEIQGPLRDESKKLFRKYLNLA